METHVAWREVHAPWQMAERAEKGHSGQAGLVTEAGRPGQVQDKEGTAGWTAATGTRVTLVMALPCTGQGTSQRAPTHRASPLSTGVAGHGWFGQTGGLF